MQVAHEVLLHEQLCIKSDLDAVHLKVVCRDREIVGKRRRPLD